MFLPERQNVPVLGVSHDCQDDDDNPDCQDLDDELVHDHPSLKVSGSVLPGHLATTPSLKVT